MAWVKEIGGIPKWVEGESYTGAIVHGFAWNCPEEKDCKERKATHAFSINVERDLNKKPKILLVQSCLYWANRKQVCGKP